MNIGSRAEWGAKTSYTTLSMLSGRGWRVPSRRLSANPLVSDQRKVLCPQVRIIAVGLVVGPNNKYPESLNVRV